MPQDFSDDPPPTAFENGIDLKHHLLRRVTLFALAIGVFASGFVLYQARERIRLHIAHTGGTVKRLIAGEAVQPRGTFQQGLAGLALASLDDIGQLLGICVAVEDIYKQPIVQRCFGEESAPPRLVHWVLGHLIGPEIQYRGRIGQYPGFAVGEFVVTPNLDSEALAVWQQIRTVLGMTLGILLLNLLVYLPVRRALLPTEQILAALGRMEAGDLAARMPRPRLIELHRIAAGFDHLTGRLQKTMAEQRQLAQRLLSVREEERRHLARELHDEFGQCLTSIGAETAFITAQTRERQPELLPAAQSIASVTAHMLESLQGILSQLRPVGLEEFGLRAGLEQLVGGWQRRLTGCTFELLIDGEIDDLPDDLTVSLYRIIQESLTNAVRHSEPKKVTVRLSRETSRCILCVEDDGEGRPASAGSGLGVLGMNERVAALAGHFSITARSPKGMRVRAEFPAEALSTQRNNDA
ncbi:sensor histidine kinase [Azoarcus sp. KH32C]|uniref:sensor histidine kinase n=1 Tax=Azoarcus sp. KH32C TaxID=748247 RepID=UPI0002385D2A|nr:sensor histidine kinase [Azoarcus sp. KH32C]BAL26990.1 two-component system, NarL family, sensor histidine kinase [Azoarcus sp. KH32C]